MARLGVDRADVLAAVGLLLLAAGLYLVYAPLALIVPGALLLLVAGAGALRGGKG